MERKEIIRKWRRRWIIGLNVKEALLSSLVVLKKFPAD